MFKKFGRTIGVLLVTFAVLTLLFQSTAAQVYDPPWAHIGDFVWEDLNMNGLQDDGDTGISGVTVTLYDSDDNMIASQLTNVTGGYYFPGKPQGLYYVVFTAPPGYVFSPQDQGADDTFDSDADPTGRTATAYVPTINRTFDAGLYQEPPPNGPGAGTPGYWKNHPEAWPVDEIIIGGVPYTKEEAIALMDGGDDKTYNMFSQLVAAKLNVLIGNDDSCIAETISAADAWMADNPVGSGVEAKSDEWDEGEPIKDTLDDYNNGLLCAPPRD